MSAKNPIEQRTQDEIRERLAPRLAAASNRQEKTRETATLLFFEYSTYPSAKVVHGYTQHGSMTDIQEDLRAFWDDLREKGRVRIEAPMFPDTINALFSEALARIWELAVNKAHAALDSEREEAAERVGQAERKADEADRMRQIAEGNADTCQSELRQEREKREAAEKKVEAQAAEIEALQSSLAKWQVQAQTEAKVRQEAQEQFSRDLEAQRIAQQRNVEILDGEVRFAKMQIEAARSTERELRDQLREEKASKEVELASCRQRANRAEEALGITRMELAECKGRYQGLEALHAELQERHKGFAKAASSRPVVKPTVKRRSLRR